MCSVRCIIKYLYLKGMTTRNFYNMKEALSESVPAYSTFAECFLNLHEGNRRVMTFTDVDDRQLPSIKKLLKSQQTCHISTGSVHFDLYGEFVDEKGR